MESWPHVRLFWPGSRHRYLLHGAAAPIRWERGEKAKKGESGPFKGNSVCANFPREVVGEGDKNNTMSVYC
jgi:hypothetical protein